MADSQGPHCDVDRSLLGRVCHGCARLFRHPMLRLAVTAGAFWLILRSINPSAVANELAHASIAWLVGAEVFVLLAIGIQILIWGLLVRLENDQLSWSRMCSLYLQGMFFAHVLPGTICGDAYRWLRTAPVLGEGVAAGSVFISRLVEILATLVTALIAAIALPSWFAHYRAWALLGLVLAVTAVSYVLFAGNLNAWFAHRSAPRNLLWQRLVHVTDDSARLLQRYRGNRLALSSSVVLSLLNWLLMLGSMVGFAQAVSADIGWPVFAIAVPLSVLTAAAPFSFNGVGLREGVLVSLLVAAGCEPARALAVAILIDAQLLPVMLMGALLWLSDTTLGKPNAAIPKEEVISQMHSV
jgi:hypothetical protein